MWRYRHLFWRAVIDIKFPWINIVNTEYIFNMFWIIFASVMSLIIHNLHEKC